MNLPPRINQKIRELKAERTLRIAKVREQVAKDKKHYRKGDLDPAPVLELLRKRALENGYGGIRVYCEVLGICDRNVERVKASGWITEKFADEMCCKLLVPFVTVYPYEQGALWEVAS